MIVLTANLYRPPAANFDTGFNFFPWSKLAYSAVLIGQNASLVLNDSTVPGGQYITQFNLEPTQGSSMVRVFRLPTPLPSHVFWWLQKMDVDQAGIISMAIHEGI